MRTRSTFGLPALFLPLVVALAAPASAGTPVFINELHYDNVGADVGEAIEIAGPVGTSLAGWQIVLYNGSGGAGGTSYDTRTLSGAIPANCGGMSAGVVVENWPENGIQNGPQDGIALVDAQGQVVQFLSYEGTLTAADGPAAGMTSTDIGVEEPSNTPIGHSLQLTGSGSDYENFSWQAPATDSFGSCNAGQSFGPAVDVPPEVAATVPATGAADVAVDIVLEVSFTEPVDVSPGWIDLVCSQSGAPALAQSGSDAHYLLTPAQPLAPSENCTVTIHAAGVTDRDGTPDPLPADHVFGFQTAADLPPEVVATSPAEGGMLVPGGSIGIVFSEPVSLALGWHALSCDSSGAHAATTSGGPTSWTLTPTVPFEPLEACTLVIDAAAVTDLDGTPDAMPADFTLHFGVAGTGGDYWAGVDTSSGPALNAWLHNRIKDHVSWPYSGNGGVNIWAILNEADEDPADAGSIIDIYRNRSYTKIPGGQGPYNREHTWPNSLGFPQNSVNGLPNPPYTDAHMLWLADTGYNASRGNKPLAPCPPSRCTRLGTDSNGGVGGGSADGDANWYELPDGNQGSFETWDHRKGDIARAVMYMAVRYQGGVNVDGIREPELRLTDDRSKIVITNAQAGSGGVAYMGLLSTLLDWNDVDPPDAGERLRHDMVYTWQDNRNPFVDHPEWARCVFTDTNCPVQGDDDLIFVDGFDGGVTLH